MDVYLDTSNLNQFSSSSQKSRYRGVYRCGRKWKAQLQSQGVQYYLGTFDTEEEAARAYDMKAKGEKGFKSLTNFDDEGRETSICTRIVVAPTEDKDLDHDTDKSPKRLKSLTNDPSIKSNFPVLEESDPVRVLWERLCQVTQRLVIAKAANEKLSEIDKLTPDPEKDRLLSALREEVVLLGIVKTQLEEAVSNAVTEGLLSIGNVPDKSKLTGVSKIEDKTKSANKTIDKSNQTIQNDEAAPASLPSFNKTFNGLEDDERFEKVP